MILPKIMVTIKEMYTFHLNVRYKRDVPAAYVPNSKIINGNTGNITGIPVSSELKIGVKIPTKIAIGSPKENPAINTGMCIGKKVVPGPNT